MPLTLTRLHTSPNAVLGVMQGVGEPIFTLEDAWRANARGASCIPAGTYACRPHGWRGEPVKFKNVWEVTAVPGRSAILIHAGNTHADTEGCILVGLGFRWVGGEWVLLESQKALAHLRACFGQTPFNLHVRDDGLTALAPPA